MQLAGAVGGEHHDRRLGGADRAELGDRHLVGREHLEQERLELVVGPVHLVDEQHHRALLERGQHRPGQQEPRVVQALLGLLDVGPSPPAPPRGPAGAGSGGGSPSRRAPGWRRCPRSTGAGSAGGPGTRPAPRPGRSCRCRARPPAAGAAPSAGRGTRPWPAPRRSGSRSRRGARRPPPPSPCAQGYAAGCWSTVGPPEGHRAGADGVRPGHVADEEGPGPGVHAEALTCGVELRPAGPADPRGDRDATAGWVSWCGWWTTTSGSGSAPTRATGTAGRRSARRCWRRRCWRSSPRSGWGSRRRSPRWCSSGSTPSSARPTTRAGC